MIFGWIVLFLAGVLCGAFLGPGKATLALFALIVASFMYFYSTSDGEGRNGVLLIYTMGAGIFLFVGGIGLVIGSAVKSRMGRHRK